MRYLISFNESFRGESIKKDLEEIFYSEVEDSGFKIYDCLQVPSRVKPVIGVLSFIK